MCGLVDYQALHTSITRLAMLASLGAITCAVRELASRWRERKRGPANHREGRSAIGLASSIVESPR